MNFGNTFRVENGVLKVAYDQYDTFGNRFGHLFYKTPFSHYVLAVEYRFVGEQVKDGPDWAFRNSGAMIHGQPVETMQKDQDFPISIEVQLLGGRGDGKPRSTANLCTPGTNVVMDGKLVTRTASTRRRRPSTATSGCASRSRSTAAGVITHKVNGETVLSYEKPQIGGGNVAKHDPAVKRDGELLAERDDLAPGGEPPGGVPQGGAAEPRRLHGREIEELPAVLREVRPAACRY